MPGVAGTKKCICCGCSGCTYAVAIIFTVARPSDASVTYTVTSPTGWSIIDTTIVDDLPNTCGTRVYFYHPSGSCASVLSDFQTEFGVDCVKDKATTTGVTNCDHGNTITITKSGGLPAGMSFIVYQICDDGTAANCRPIQAGPLSTTCSANTIEVANSCCPCSTGTPCNFTVVTDTGSVCLYDPALVLCDAIALHGTGLVSVKNIYSWSNLGGTAGTDLGNVITGVTTGGVGFTATLEGPGHFERRCAAFPSYSGDFTPDEPLLFAAPPASSPPIPYAGDILFVFDQPVQAAGFRVQQNNASFRDDYFIDAAVTLTPPGAGTGLFVDASAPGPDSTPFYGVAGSTNSCTFSTLRVGFAGSFASGPKPPGYAISTLEVAFCPVTVPHQAFLANTGDRLLFDNGKGINVAF